MVSIRLTRVELGAMAPIVDWCIRGDEIPNKKDYKRNMKALAAYLVSLARLRNNKEASGSGWEIECIEIRFLTSDYSLYYLFDITCVKDRIDALARERNPYVKGTGGAL